MTHAPDPLVRMERAIAALLWSGTWLASALIAAGLLLAACPASAAQALPVSGSDLSRVGVAVFILLPVARVALMLFLFLRARDFVYSVIATLVLAIIATGVLIAR